MKKLLTFATLALVMAGTSLAQNLVTNGGFDLGNSSNTLGFGGLVGWTPYNETAAHYNSIDANTFLDDGTYSSVVSGPHSGPFMADFGAWENGATGISQSIATQAGHTYQVSFWLANDDGCTDRGCFTSIEVEFAGTTLISDSYQERIGWTFHSFDVTATGSSSELIFNIEQDPAYYELDDVSVTETPEPATLTLLGSALGLGAGFIRRFRS
jgi:hypothetical protein